ncbi:putative RNA polymerase ECF-subfamily sigma factor [Actinoplanes missouriensis 431]|uniref:Putative RNA polymerase ECF-subfamily sigma factor n=1 Tax=Actinoplanes missouriensis (strain ATCC 14538 / DSM 43046 / CBS 188.64 / JCM 3121 / NBRC 102363 / NCIMB 12654 / NRRL B-3342 / UNCC 431) TaxID=512565 RepID=I0H257_ACTM4|nr:putative RNA polymerase ECF-subfamily sigma factor [Actinoplanes missouriensis 431]
MVGAADWEDQFVDYFRARAQPLRRLAYSLSGDWHTAEDLVQQTFVRLYRRWPAIRDETVDAYARQALVNAFLSHRRARRRESLTADPPERAAGGADPADGLVVRRALAALAPRQRAAVVLRYLEDLPVAEVATLLGISEGTVKSQTARAIQSMRDAALVKE